MNEVINNSQKCIKCFEILDITKFIDLDNPFSKITKTCRNCLENQAIIRERFREKKKNNPPAVDFSRSEKLTQVAGEFDSIPAALFFYDFADIPAVGVSEIIKFVGVSIKECRNIDKNRGLYEVNKFIDRCFLMELISENYSENDDILICPNCSTEMCFNFPQSGKSNSATSSPGNFPQSGKSNSRISIKRYKPDVGYTKNNIILICQECKF
jgi:hypothetical protein